MKLLLLNHQKVWLGHGHNRKQQLNMFLRGIDHKYCVKLNHKITGTSNPSVLLSGTGSNTTHRHVSAGASPVHAKTRLCVVVSR